MDSWFERRTANRGDNPGEGWLDVTMTMTMLLNPTPSHLRCPYNTLGYVPNQNVLEECNLMEKLSRRQELERCTFL